jgi:hypothetical protein
VASLSTTIPPVAQHPGEAGVVTFKPVPEMAIADGLVTLKDKMQPCPAEEVHPPTSDWFKLKKT